MFHFYLQKQRGNKVQKKKAAQGDLASYKVDDTVWAKMKAISSWNTAWPARIEAKKDKGYDVFFFGSGTRSFLKAGNIRPYQVCGI